MKDLSDGLVLSKFLVFIDDVYFNSLTSIKATNNWVYRKQNFKKIKIIIIKFYYEKFNNINFNNTGNNELDNLQILNHENEEQEDFELLDMLRDILFISINSRRKSYHVEKLQLLSIETQECLKIVIEECLKETKKKQETGNNEDIKEAIKLEKIKKEKQELINAYKDVESNYNDIMEQYSQLKEINEEQTEQNKNLMLKVKEMEKMINRLSNSNEKDEIIKFELEDYREKLSLTEKHKTECEKKIKKLQYENEELNNQLLKIGEKEEEILGLKKEISRFMGIEAKLRKTEIILDKFKRKIDEHGETMKKYKSLEQTNTKLTTKINKTTKEKEILERKTQSNVNYESELYNLNQTVNELKNKNNHLQLENTKLNQAIQELEYEKEIDQLRIGELENNFKHFDQNDQSVLENENNNGQLLHELQISDLKTNIQRQEKELNAYKQKEREYNNNVEQIQTLNHEIKRLTLSLEAELASRNELELRVDELLKPSLDNSEGCIQNYPDILKYINNYNMEIYSILKELRQKRTIPGEESNCFDYEAIVRTTNEIQKTLVEKIETLLQTESKELNNLKDELMQKEILIENYKKTTATKANASTLAENVNTLIFKNAALNNIVHKQDKYISQLKLKVKRARQFIIMQEQKTKQLKTTNNEPNNEAELKEAVEKLNQYKNKLFELKKHHHFQNKLVVSAWYDIGLKKNSFFNHNLKHASFDDSSNQTWLDFQRGLSNPVNYDK